ncbi:autotransporter secretion inner membrane protein TamB [Yoonia tamlensis]|uniref:Autotransporter secretion inner membrane protein TamB n=1 Tax=Yoonia tamlensis TaxID=390270 RepID=A0A1I6HPJ9_9RHOB|nr:translocation/assembly module TamB domain-containing protein [Yoonia tamlensis]SFR56379.1 autotransporter secretion inner membrane protein TamB [Yoonia tamlensis]
MRHIFALFCLFAPLCAYAQTQADEDKGYLTNLIEENLSGVSRDVNIIGFAGALSSNATIDVLTVADAQGVWLTLEDIVLIWSRSALLRGAIEVQELSAARIIVARPPLSEDAAGPSAEATPFALPELPVSITLGQLDIDEIILGDAFLGEEISVSLTGEAALGGGEGTAKIVATRLGAKSGVFEINGGYSNETQVLDLLLNLEEGADGIAARMLDLPGRPAIKLGVTGTAPIDDFAASIAIATDGQDRLNGGFALRNAAGERRISLDVGGDISPLFNPEYQGFFGTDAQLSAAAVLSDTGRIDIPAITIDAGRVSLTGAMQIGAQGWPEMIDLTGAITPVGDAPVLLPLTGPKTFVNGAQIVVSYDAQLADDWRADITTTGFDRPGLRIETLHLRGGGILKSGEGDQIGQFTANLAYGATGLSLDDAGAARALGDSIAGVFTANRTEEEPTEITQLTLHGAGIDIDANAIIDGPRTGFETQANARVAVTGLDRFSTLTGQALGGDTALDLQAAMTPLDGLFDITLAGQTNGLSIGNAQADAVLAGVGTIAARVLRDTTGTRLENLQIETSAAAVTASADLTNAGAKAQFTALLPDVAVILPDLTGPVSLRGDIARTHSGTTEISVNGTGPAASFQADATLNPASQGQTINAAITAVVTDLSRYADLAGQPVAGRAEVTAHGVLLGDGSRFDVDIAAETTDLQIGNARIDPLLAGAGQVAVSVARPADGQLSLSDIAVTTPALALRGAATIDNGGATQADIDLRVFDAGLLDPSLSGPIAASVTATPGPDATTQTQVRLSGPGATLGLDAAIGTAAQGYPIAGELTGELTDIAAYAGLVGRSVSGQVAFTASGDILPDLSRFDLQISARSQDLQLSNPSLDPLIAGVGRVNATIGLADGILGVRTLELSTPQLSIVGALNGAAGHGQGRFNASLRDVGVLTDQISGPVRATGSASLDEAGNWGIDATGTGPGGLQANISGTVNQSLQMALRIDGAAPLALANAAIEPRRLSGTANFDIDVNGPPALTSVSGRVTFADGRLTAPTFKQALSDIGGQINLTGTGAQIDLRAGVEGGGSLAIRGPVALTGARQADLTLLFNDVVQQDPELYATIVNGQITMNGPLGGGARIDGRLTLGQTDIQVPSSSISSLGDLPDVVHLNAGAAVRQTMQRAGVGQADETSGGSGSKRAYPLNIVIDAPSRIFIRGRGLDAELGGQLTIGGTTANVVPVGRFELVRGRIDILQQRFDLTEGSATMQGDFSPFLRLVATTQTASGTTINIIVEGPAGAPEVTFESIPELPQDEVLSQLIFGRDLQSISPLQAVQLAAAVSTLAGKGGGAVDRLRQNIGLDDFDVTTDDEGNAAVRAGKYLSDNVYTDVTITSDGSTEINLNLDITNEITAKGSVDQDGETSVGVFFERDY